MPNSHRARRLTAIAVGLVLAALLGACGVPSSGPPVLDGNGTRQGSGYDGPGKLLPPGPGGVTSPADLVSKYLEAVAGQTDPQSTAAQNALRAFMGDPASRSWQPSKTVTVVHQLGDLSVTPEQQASTIEGNFQVIGLLSLSEGTLEPAPPGQDGIVPLKFVASGVPADGNSVPGLRFDDVPDGVYMSDAALVDYYTAHSVYFWDSANEVLVPELRYVPQTISQIQAQTLVVNWVLAGPSDTLGAAAQRIVTTSLLDPQVQEGNGRIIVDLAATPKFAPSDQLRLGNQLRWSLLGLGRSGGLNPPAVDIYMAGQQQQLVADEPSLDAANPVSRRHAQPPEYAIGRNGVVQPVFGPQSPLFNSPSNTNVRLAAINTDQTNAALVRDARDGRVDLWVRRTGAKARDFVKVLGGTTMSRPVWVWGSNSQNSLVVVVDGKLKFVDANNKEFDLTTGIGAIKSVSVAPDGRRVALVTDKGALYTSALVWSSTVPSLMTPRRLHPAYEQDLLSVDAVAWSKTDQLAIGARAGTHYQLFEVNSDGATTTQLSESMPSSITQLVAYSLDGRTSDAGTIVFQTGSDARRVRPGTNSEHISWVNKNSGDAEPTSPFVPD